jgi:hypothetical protein
MGSFPDGDRHICKSRYREMASRRDRRRRFAAKAQLEGRCYDAGNGQVGVKEMDEEDLMN